MILEYIFFRVLPEERESFEWACAQAALVLGKAPQCLGFDLSRCVEDPVQYTLRVKWQGIEEHLKGFRQGPLFEEYFTALAPYFPRVEQMHHYQMLIPGP